MPSMSLADPAMDETRGLKLYVTVNPAHADKLFAGTGHTFREILDAADASKPLPHFAIPVSLKATTAVKRAEVVSQNVVARLPGSDPKLRDEYVVFSGTSITWASASRSRTMRSSTGRWTMLRGSPRCSTSPRCSRSPAQVGRSVLFVAVTGEEKGLLGSKFFAHSPTVDARKIVADINTDMFLPLFPMKSLTIYGMDESDLGTDAATAAESLGIAPRRDPEPKRNVFIRSDQYSFIRRGIPSLALKVGFDKGSPEERIVKQWLTERTTRLRTT